MRVISSFLFSFFYLAAAASSGEGQGFLFNRSAVDAGNIASQAIFGDFNGDGRADLASLNSNNTVSIMLGQANATFAPAVSYEIGNSPYTFIASSLRKGNTVDLITVNMPNGVDASGTISVLLGNGDGTFASHVDYQVGDYPTGVVAGDFNDDGRIDLAVSNNSDSTISILYGKGDGTFQSQVLVDVGSGPMSIGTGDFNGDGKLDLIASCVGSGVVSVLLNDGKRKFTRVDSPSGLESPDMSLVVTGDFNSDGKLDAVISSRLQGRLYLLAGKGDGTFNAPLSLSKTGLGEIYSLTTADINNDEQGDLAVGAVGPNGLFVMLGEGNGKFRAPIFSSVAGVSSIAFADVNGDGSLDVVVPVENLGMLNISLGNGKGQFGPAKTIKTQKSVYGPNSSVAADFSGDGKLDLAIAEENFPNGQISVVLGNGEGGFGSPIVSPLLSEAINNNDRMLSGDFNGDGKLDLIIMDDYATGFQVLLGNGDGTFQAPVDSKLNTSLNFAIGDFNGDGKTDVVVTTIVNAQASISIYLSNGDGTFKLGAQYTQQYGGANVADVNGDGKLDLEFISFGEPILTMLGNGDGTFQKAIAGPNAIFNSEAAIEDFDGDGRPDIVVGTYNGLAFLKGNGDGTFRNPVYSNADLSFCCETRAVDLNGDGKLDLFSGSNNAGGVLAMIGNGDGTFQTPVIYETNGQISSGNIVAGDFNSDHIGDIGIVYQDLSFGTTDVALDLSKSTVAVFPTAINFGSVKVGQTSQPVAIEVTNVGNGTLSVPSITAVGGDFLQQNNCPKRLKIGESCTIQAQFKPQTKGVQSGAITIKDNALVLSQQVALAGTGN